MPARTLLLNWVYYYPVGHAVEAFKTAKGLYNPNPDLEIHVLLNSRTPVELARACDWIAHAHAIDLDQFTHGENHHAPCLESLPREWDFIVTDHRVATSPFPFTHPLRNFHETAARRFQARLWQGGHHQLQQEAAAPRYHPNSTIRMRVPDSASSFLQTLAPGSVNIAVLPAGSSPEPIYPTPAWWQRALRLLADQFPEAHFFLTGKSFADDRSSTLAFSAVDAAHLAAADSRIHNCYDVGLWNQLALLEWCDLLIAPHTGFAFLAPSVGTSWLSLSGVRWPECYFNEVPFYCVLPACGSYPCWKQMLPACRQRLAALQQVPCMQEDLDATLPDLLHAARLLLSPGFSFEKAMALHQARIDARYPRDRFFQIV